MRNIKTKKNPETTKPKYIYIYINKINLTQERMQSKVRDQTNKQKKSKHIYSDTKNADEQCESDRREKMGLIESFT